MKKRNKKRSSLNIFLLGMIRGAILGMIIVFIITFVYASIIFTTLLYRFDKIQKSDFYPLPEFKLREKYGNETIDEIKNISYQVNSSFKYEAGIFDCSQLSQELVIELRLKNYNASCVSGFYMSNNDFSGHTWVEVYIEDDIVPIEATTGELIFWNYDNYKITERHLCR